MDATYIIKTWLQHFLPQRVHPLNKVTLWIAGTEDIAYENFQVMLSKFKELNIKYTNQEYVGGHT